MNENFILKESKETVMTFEKTKVAVTKSLEEIDIFGKSHLKAYYLKMAVIKNPDYAAISDLGRAA